MTTQAAQDAVAAAAEVLERLLPGRRDIHGGFHFQRAEGITVKEPLTWRVWRRHIEGDEPCGVFPITAGPDRTFVCGWAAVDVDREGDVPEAERIAREICAAAKHFGVQLWPERSRGKGVHLWMFCETIEVWMARAVLRMALEHAGFKETSAASGTKGQEIVVFPKQDQLTERRPIGNFMFAPWFGPKTREGKMVFLHPETFERLPDQVETMSAIARTPAALLREIVEVNGLTRQNVQPIRDDVEAPKKSSGAVARPGELEALTDREFEALCKNRALVALHRCYTDPSGAPYALWYAALIHLVPFADGEARARQLSEMDGKRYSERGFDHYWKSAVNQYMKDHLDAKTPRVTQRVVDYWRGGGDTDVVPENRKYGVKDGRLCALTKDGPMTLANFHARIVSEEFVDDGSGIVDRKIAFEGELADGRKLERREIDAEEISEIVKWLPRCWGSRPIILNAWSDGRRAQVVEALQLAAQNVPENRVYVHTGWVQKEGRWGFLHAGGAIARDAETAEKIIGTHTIRLPEELQRYALAGESNDASVATGYDWVERFLLCADARVSGALMGAIFLAPLASLLPLGFGLALIGPTGTRKSSLTAAALSLWGAFTKDNLPLSFMSTMNFIERVGFLGKDLPLVIDNFVPSMRDAHQSLFTRLAHTLGDQTGRGRMTSAQEIRSARPVRAMTIVTGEDFPEGHSATARLYICTLHQRTVHLERLAAFQEAAAAGHLSGVMPHYLRWLARKLEDSKFLTGLVERHFNESRALQIANPSEHGRLFEQTVWLRLGLELAEKSSPRGRWRHSATEIELDTGFRTQARERGAIVTESSIACKFVRAMVNAINRGLIAGVHHRHEKTAPPMYPERFGWSVDGADAAGRKIHPEAFECVWVHDVDSENPGREWYIYVQGDELVALLRDRMPASYKLTESPIAIGAALEAAGVLKPESASRRSVKQHVVGRGRERVWKLKGAEVLGLIGLGDDGGE